MIFKSTSTNTILIWDHLIPNWLIYGFIHEISRLCKNDTKSVWFSISLQYHKFIDIIKSSKINEMIDN